MKKCPVCGVEHSDIVPVCSICGSPLSGGDVIADGKESAVEPLKAAAETVSVPEKVETEPAADFSDADILAAVSSVVSSSMGKDEGGEEDPFDIDSPFVVNAMKSNEDEIAKPAAPKKAASSRKVTGRNAKAAKAVSRNNTPKKEAESAKTEADVMDTTAIAAASALKVQEAMKNAEAARARQAEAAETAEGIAEPQQTAQERHNWTERKHKRNQKSTTTPVIAAVCALLALLIVAMLFLLGKMMLDDGQSNKPDDDSQQTGTSDTQEPGTEDGDAADGELADGEENTDILSEDEILPDADSESDASAEGEGEGADTQEPAQTGADTQEPAESTDGNAQPDLPEITEVSDTVYTTATVNVRDYPSTDNSTVINVLSAGQAVTRTGKTAAGWSRVEINGTVGYVSNTYLSATKPDAEPDNSEKDTSSETVRYINSNGVNLRAEPNGTVLATLTQNQKVTLTGKTSGSWTQVKADGVTGYVYNTYLSAKKVSESDSDDGGENTAKDDSDVKVTKVNETVYATAGVNVRDYPSGSQGTVITVLTKGQAVTRTGKTANGWSRIEVGGVTGYVYSDYLSTSKNSSSSDDDDSSSGGTISGYILPKSNSKNYTADELSGLSKSELRLARNEIYARHGRKFTDASLQKYFDSCTWYKGTIDAADFDANVSSYLNSYELANLDLIKSLE